MASDIRLRVGNVTVLRPLGEGFTDQQIGDALKRTAQSLGINTESSAQQWGGELVDYWVDDARKRAKALRLREIEAGQAAANDTQAEQDTPL